MSEPPPDVQAFLDTLPDQSRAALLELRERVRSVSPDLEERIGYGVPAFNINNMEQVLAIMAAADECDAPVILQASRGARSYAGDIMLAKMVEAAEAAHPGIPICLHQDHGNDAPCGAGTGGIDPARVAQGSPACRPATS